MSNSVARHIGSVKGSPTASTSATMANPPRWSAAVPRVGIRSGWRPRRRRRTHGRSSSCQRHRLNRRRCWSSCADARCATLRATAASLACTTPSSPSLRLVTLLGIWLACCVARAQQVRPAGYPAQRDEASRNDGDVGDGVIARRKERVRPWRGCPQHCDVAPAAACASTGSRPAHPPPVSVSSSGSGAAGRLNFAMQSTARHRGHQQQRRQQHADARATLRRPGQRKNTSRLTAVSSRKSMLSANSATEPICRATENSTKK